MYNQIILPKVDTPYVGGLCEKWVENTTGQTGIYPTATRAWELISGKHPSELPPKGIRVALYFSLGSTKDGHTTIQLEDGRVASSTLPGYHTTAYIHPSLTDLIDVYGRNNNGCKYLGWTEYIGKLQVVKGENMITISDEEYKDLLAWKAIGQDAQPYKNGVVNSKAWATDMQTDVNLITPVIDDLWQFKKDHVNDKPGSYVPYNGKQLYTEK